VHLNPRTLDVELSPIAAAYGWLEHRQRDRRLLDLSQAAPAYPTADVIVDRVVDIARSPDGGRYAPSKGLPELRAVFADVLGRDHGSPISVDQIQITAGCNQAFCVVASALCQPGDEMIICVPYYFNHRMWLDLDGIRPVFLPSGPGFVPDPTRAASLITDRTRAILLVSPGNPTGATIPPDVLDAFFELAESRGVALVLDETYRNFRPTDAPSHTLYSRPGWEDTLVTLHSFSKEFAIPGYRVGAICGNQRLIDEALKLLDCVAICAPRIGQEAALAGLTHAGDWQRAQTERTRTRERAFVAAMAGAPGGFELANAGAYFGWVRHPLIGVDDREMVRRLVVDHDILVIPGTAFTPTDDRWLRFSFANLEIDDFAELAARLAAVT
jgi:aspartate/methionine/tyrosine aminotransferase